MFLCLRIFKNPSLWIRSSFLIRITRLFLPVVLCNSWETTKLDLCTFQLKFLTIILCGLIIHRWSKRKYAMYIYNWCVNVIIWNNFVAYHCQLIGCGDLSGHGWTTTRWLTVNTFIALIKLIRRRRRNMQLLLVFVRRNLYIKGTYLPMPWVFDLTFYSGFCLPACTVTYCQLWFKRVWLASRERLPFRTPGSVPLLGTCLCSYCWDQFYRTFRSFLDFPPWLSRFCLNKRKKKNQPSWQTISRCIVYCSFIACT